MSQVSHLKSSYYGHGKLMLTSEYFALEGAKVLTIPVQFGQHLRVKELSGEGNTLYWVALDHLKQPWLHLTFDKQTLQCINTDSKESRTLSQMLQQARLMNPSFLGGNNDIAVETSLEFPNEWGLGTSSTLVYCLSAWAGVDGVALLHATMGGSGYDVAVAGSDTPIVYTLIDGKASWEQVHFLPPYAELLYFAYTGKKVTSSTSIASYRDRIKGNKDAVTWLTKLTDSMLQSQTLDKMEQIIREHEAIVSEALHTPTIKSQLFSDYWGEVKSLGAWGGDFVLMTHRGDEEELLSYLKRKDISVVMRYDKMAIST
ncbi:MAG: GHMP kinase [Bacteroidetes bacterium]|nr:GHMP kinase [Bacteroidota bacterium]